MGSLCNKVDSGEYIYQNKVPKEFKILERKKGSLAHGELS